MVPIVLLATSCGSAATTSVGASGGGSGGASGGAAAAGTLVVSVVAGPTCPAQPISSATCRNRAVPGATLHAAGATLTTSRDGRASEQLPPGRFTITADPVDGYMSFPAPVSFTVRPGHTTRVRLVYDTGIR